ncbi:MAG: murein biosynthesis integral membrane protein MurJ, partial [Gammaproteobacteria bacterium]
MSEKLLKRTVTVGSMTLISRVFGFVRDMVFDRFFGTGLAMDAFFVAFKITNFLRRLFAEGAFSHAFVPVLSEYKKQRSEQDVHDLVDRVSGTLLGILSVLTLLGVAASPVLVALFAPGFLADDSKFAVTAQMLRITFPYLLFISLVSFAAGVLNSYGRFSVPAFAPVLLNVMLIGAAVWVAPSMEQPVVALAWGVFIAGILQLALLVYALKCLGMVPKPRWGFRDEGVQRILRLMMPAIFGTSVVQINLLFDTLIASFLVTGSVSWLYFSDRMVEFPLGVFAIALSTVILPSLSHSHADGNRDKFQGTLDWALRWACVIGIPAAIGLFLLAGPILSTLFEYQRFSAQDVHLSSLSLMGYAFGLPAFMMVKVLAPGFYSRQDTRMPV